jgi:hypothetical protein
MSEQRLREILEQARQATALPGGFVYRGPADFVLRHGQTFAVRRWQKEWFRGQPRMCFGNSIIAAFRHGWRYVEGFALNMCGTDAVLHAWNSADGQLIDTTWLNGGLAYIGVEFALGRADDATWNGDACVLNDRNRQYGVNYADEQKEATSAVGGESLAGAPARATNPPRPDAGASGRESRQRPGRLVRVGKRHPPTVASIGASHRNARTGQNLDKSSRLTLQCNTPLPRMVVLQRIIPSRCERAVP